MVSTLAVLSTALLFGGMTLYSFGFAAFLFKALPAKTVPMMGFTSGPTLILDISSWAPMLSLALGESKRVRPASAALVPKATACGPKKIKPSSEMNKDESTE